ncbi:MAG: sialate O-acetylesterase [Defluviitaleaceae bacterium]|nr:sialate O-acetylesterase [Defluviitaleaceae bacterium]
MIKLPSFFSDGMVIGKTARLWGWVLPGETVVTDFLDTIYESVADENGRFEVTVKASDYGGPYTMAIGTEIICDVYVGRVWLCGGSSGMEEPTSRARLVTGEKITEDARIRVFSADRSLNFLKSADNVTGSWLPATGEFLHHMNAVPYFFARKLLETDPAPVGLICLPVGGSTIEGWLPEEIVHEFPDYYRILSEAKQPGYIANINKEHGKRVKIWQGSLAVKDKGLQEKWFSPDYDDTGWESQMLFDTSKMPRHGSVWLRRKFNMSVAGGPVVLRFGRVEDSITVYVNGVEAIHVGYKYPPCACVLPEGLIVEGENTIAIRIVGETGQPSIVRGKEYALIYPGGRAELNGRWKRRTGAVMPMCPPGIYFYSYPSGVYNAMLAPLNGYSVDGIIWSQGESNTAKPHDYKALFSAFAKNIRTNFGNVPIIFTQLSNYVDPHSYNFIEGFGAPGEYWAILREQQRQCLEIPNTAMAVTIDCGEFNDLHPTNQKTAGERLALHARRLAYNEDLISDGPVVTKAEYRGKRLTIFFKHGEGLWEKGGHPIPDVIDGEGVVHRLYAAIWDDALNIIVGDMNPVAVRFGWADCPVVSLHNAYNLPASPFEISVTNAESEEEH